MSSKNTKGKTLGSTGWLVFKKAKQWRPIGTELTTRFSLKKPTVGPDERAIKIKIAMPASVFEEPEIVASLFVNEDDISYPEVDFELEQEDAEQ